MEDSIYYELELTKESKESEHLLHMPRQRENWICDWDMGPMEKSCDIVDK